MPINAHVDDIWLSQRVRVAGYKKMELAEDRAGMAKFVFDRFMERYILPVEAVPKADENGFLSMAACCLLIEALEAFRQGWDTTDGRSLKAFKLFFGRERRFAAFVGLEFEFWKNVRCGLLHHGETTGGWLLNFSRPADALLKLDPPFVNCFKFVDALEGSLEDYRDELKQAPWQDALWTNFRTKMTATIKDCKR